MKIAVTGASGLVGGQVVRAALADGHEVTAIVRSTGSAQLSGLDIRQVRAGLRDGRRLGAALHGVEGLVHCAAVYAFGADRADPRGMQWLRHWPGWSSASTFRDSSERACGWPLRFGPPAPWFPRGPKDCAGDSVANLGTGYLVRCDIHTPDRRRDPRLWGAVNAGWRLEAVKSTGDALIDALYGVRKGQVELVDIPELGFLVVDGVGDPAGETFHDAIQALYAVSYGAHFALKKATGDSPRVMPLEALWWVEGADAQATMERIAAGKASMNESRRDQWHWRAMIMQLAPIDAAVIDQAITEAKAKNDTASLSAARYERWAEGPCAQIMHIGPYATEAASIVALHQVIAEYGTRPVGRHHEIYLGDPRTSAPEKLRTILRQPIKPASDGVVRR